METSAEFRARKAPKDRHEKSGYVVKKILWIFFVIIFVILILCGGVLIFHNTYFKTFFVNGQSMYPTLNQNAKDEKGNILSPTSGNSGLGYTVDFGIMDQSKYRLSKLQRGDIVITYYKSDYNSEGLLNPNVSTKIKRIVGLPGEKIALDGNGDLLVNGVLTMLKGNHVYTSTPEGNRKYPTGQDYIELGVGEYFVLGDNRDNSQDSRKSGVVLFDYIIGVAVAVEGTCKIGEKIGKDGHKITTCESKRYFWPSIL